MAKEKFDRNKPHVNVGPIGHIDHGKTTLSDSRVRLATLAVLAMFALKTWVRRKDTMHLDKN